MTPVALVLAVAAGLAGAALVAPSAVRTAPSPVRLSGSTATGPALDVRAAGSGPRFAPEASAAPAVSVAPAVPVVSAAPLTVAPRAPAARFRWPLFPAPEVLRRFVVGPHPWSPGHRGVDLGSSEGQQVLAAGAGTVAFAGVVAGRGVVTIAHSGGLRTTYEPVTARVRAGQGVAAGERLGVLATGNHCPTACLHWGALLGDVYVDPLGLLRPPAPPILLPLGGVPTR